jgi:mono/diheme cytochrome c family protein
MRSFRDSWKTGQETDVKLLAPFCPVLGLAVLVPLASAAAPATRATESTPTAQPVPGRAFAQGSCGGCHAVEPRTLSPNPAAPPFPAIVNREGVTRETLTAWLRDAHNYPEEMEFYLEKPEVDELVSYMLNLRDPNYRPAS